MRIKEKRNGNNFFYLFFIYSTPEKKYFSSTEPSSQSVYAVQSLGRSF